MEILDLIVSGNAIKFLPIFFGFFLTVFLCFMVLKWFPRIGLVDKPELYGYNRKPIPYAAGIVLILSFISGLFVFGEFSMQVIATIFVVLMLASVSFFDDVFKLSPFVRLFVQVLCALVLVGSGVGIWSVSNPFGADISLNNFEYTVQVFDLFFTITLIADLFFIVWLLSLINIVNWIDGVNGLLSGVATIAFGIIFCLAIKPDFHLLDQSNLIVMSALMFGSCLAFWMFDFYPAKLLMGDTGSMFIGLMIGVLAVFSGGKLATTALVLAFPILDAFWVILRRIFEGKSPMKGDMGHLHHRFLKAGFGERVILAFYYSISLLFGLVALLLSGSYQKLIGLIIVSVLMLLVAIYLVKFKKVN